MNERPTDEKFAISVLGKRFTTDFIVVALGPGSIAILSLHQGLYEISIAVLRTLVERGMVSQIDKDWTAPGGTS